MLYYEVVVGSDMDGEMICAKTGESQKKVINESDKVN